MFFKWEEREGAKKICFKSDCVETARDASKQNGVAEIFKPTENYA